MSNIVASEIEPAAAAEAALRDTEEFEQLVRRQLELLGEDPDREGLRRTPARVARSLTWVPQGYETDVREVVGDALFEDPHDNMIMVCDIELYSMCEHHLLPFIGRCHVAYLPSGKVIGLSKIARIVDMFGRRMQIQENLTKQIAEAVMQVTGAKGVGVVIEAKHLCMMMRGVEKQNSVMTTSVMLGYFRKSQATRNEFLKLLGRV
jgi:GTP cyclohydrolase I